MSSEGNDNIRPNLPPQNLLSSQVQGAMTSEGNDNIRPNQPQQNLLSSQVGIEPSQNVSSRPHPIQQLRMGTYSSYERNNVWSCIYKGELIEGTESVCLNPRYQGPMISTLKTILTRQTAEMEAQKARDKHSNAEAAGSRPQN